MATDPSAADTRAATAGVRVSPSAYQARLSSRKAPYATNPAPKAATPAAIRSSPAPSVAAPKAMRCTAGAARPIRAAVTGSSHTAMAPSPHRTDRARAWRSSRAASCESLGRMAVWSGWATMA
jgi:hypothetical protein